MYNHLILLGYQVSINRLGALEIDFIAEKNGEKRYYQVALSINDEKTIEHEFGNLKKIKDNYPKTVITLDVFQGNSHEGIQVLDLRSFLKFNHKYN